uniref:Uncharacterized protein n=1 Tax=Trichuris muris TaxID=70415 RepID=A0A5S6QDM8_TRIMR
MRMYGLSARRCRSDDGRGFACLNLLTTRGDRHSVGNWPTPTCSAKSVGGAPSKVGPKAKSEGNKSKKRKPPGDVVPSVLVRGDHGMVRELKVPDEDANDDGPTIRPAPPMEGSAMGCAGFPERSPIGSAQLCESRLLLLPGARCK